MTQIQTQEVRQTWPLTIVAGITGRAEASETELAGE
jgi:hypothetical protein